MKIEALPSPNFNDRKHPIDMLVLHYTGMETGLAALDRMRDEAAGVSAHYMLWEDGRVVQLVGEDKRAWHAGVSKWQGDEDLNSRSIGIEIVNGGHDWPLTSGVLPAYPNVQIDALIELCHGILERWDIPASRIVGHSDIAPMRKQDPGEHFPWECLARSGIGLWPAPGSEHSATSPDVIDIGRVQRMLARIGYDVPQGGVFDDQTKAVLFAFQRHWMQDAVTGGADTVTFQRIAQLHEAYQAAASEHAEN